MHNYKYDFNQGQRICKSFNHETETEDLLFQCHSYLITANKVVLEAYNIEPTLIYSRGMGLFEKLKKHFQNPRLDYSNIDHIVFFLDSLKNCTEHLEKHIQQLN